MNDRNASSPTIMIDFILITAAIEAVEMREVAMIDLPGAFLQAEMDDVVHMALQDKLAKLMVNVSPKRY